MGVDSGNVLHSDCVLSGNLSVVNKLAITAHASDGKVFSSEVCMALNDYEDVLVTAEAQRKISFSAIWYHLGGYNDDGDTYDTQEYEFGKTMDQFWADFIGPDENLRQLVFKTLWPLKGWGSIHISKDGQIKVVNEDGTEKIILPPSLAKKAA